MRNLSHLTESQINTLIKRYYKGEKVENLKQEYNITSQSSYLFKLFPPMRLSEIFCRHCNINMEVKRGSKKANLEKPYCPKCNCRYVNHLELITSCNCFNCLKLQEEANQANLKKRLEQLGDFFELEAKKIKTIETLHDLSFKDSIFLITLIKTLSDGHLSPLTPLYGSPTPMAPTDKLSLEIIDYLYSKKLIYIHHNSPMEAFIFNSENEIEYHMPSKCIFGFNFEGFNTDSIENYFELESKIEGLTLYLCSKELLEKEINPFFIESRAELIDLINELALHECIAYLSHLMKWHELNFKHLEEKTCFFKKIIHDFSVSEIYNFIWTAVINATAFRVRNGTSNKVASETIPVRCQTFAKNVLNNRATKREFNRDLNCARSMLSIVLYDHLLKSEDLGFRKTCSEIVGL